MRRSADHKDAGRHPGHTAAKREPKPVSGRVENGTRECDILIRNAYVITMDQQRTVFRNGAVAITGREISMVGPEREVVEKYVGRDTLDAHGAPVHPGFVDAHWHNCNETTRGVFPDKATTKEYYKYYAAWYDQMTADDEYASARLSALEMLRNGTTCFMEAGTAFETSAVAEAATSVGIRASLSEPFLWDQGDDATLSRMTRIEPSTKRCHDLLGSELWRNREDGLIRGHVCLFGSGSASDEIVREACELAEKNQVVFTQHQSSTLAGVAAQEARTGRKPLVHYGELGLLKPHCSFTHMTLVRDDEARYVRESGMSIIWSPAISMNWGWVKGFARRHQELFRAGVNVALGSDVPKFGLDGAGMFAYLLSREAGDAEPLSAEEVFQMSTLGGARAMCIADSIGSIEPGKLADVVVRSSELPEFQPGHYLVQNLVLASRGKSVDTVIVNGAIVVRGGHSTQVDEGEVFAAARDSANRLAQNIGVRAESPWRMVD